MALSISEPHVGEPFCALQWERWNEIHGGRWSHQNHQQDHLLKRTSDGHICWSCWWGTRQQGPPSAVRHSSENSTSYQSQKCLCTGCGETPLGTTHWHFHLHTPSNVFCFIYDYFIHSTKYLSSLYGVNIIMIL